MALLGPDMVASVIAFVGRVQASFGFPDLVLESRTVPPRATGDFRVDISLSIFVTA